MNLLDTRKQYNLTQLQAAQILGVPLRTYLRYEKEESYGNDLKRKMMLNTLIEECEITETKGILKLEDIKKTLNKLFDEEYKNQIEFCYLFGSYAKGYAKGSSDVDLCVSTSLQGLDFVGLKEAIATALHKEIDLIRFSNLKDNIELINEIMKDGIKVYG